jgi:GTPase SAR1 family protein
MSYSGMDVVLICFAVDNQDSLSNVEEKWIPELEREMGKLNENMPIVVLVGNKGDLADNSPEWNAWRESANELAKRIGAYNDVYYECSAMMDEGVNIIFEDAVRACLRSGSGAGGGCCLLQ